MSQQDDNRTGARTKVPGTGVQDVKTNLDKFETNSLDISQCYIAMFDKSSLSSMLRFPVAIQEVDMHNLPWYPQ